MSDLNVTVTDAVGTQRQDVTVPGDAAIVKLIAALVKQLSYPLTSPDGSPMSYKMHHKESGRQLSDASTLLESGVSDGDTLSLFPEIIAG